MELVGMLVHLYTIYRSNSEVNVHDHKTKNIAKVVGATLREGFLAYSTVDAMVAV